MTEPSLDGAATKRACLVLFTNYFPYHRGEEYVETELPYLVDRFERVVIVPVMFESGMPLTRDLPDGVVVVPVDMPSNRRARAWHVVTNARGVRRAGLATHTARPWRPLRFLYDWYFTTRGMEFWKRARTDILDAVGDSADVVIYSYWLYVTALEAVLLRRELGARASLAVSRAHRYDVMTPASALHFLPQRRLLVTALDRVHPVSESGVQALVHDVPDLRDRIAVRRLGVGAPAAIGPRANRPRLEVISCSSLKPVKRVPLLVDALAQLDARGLPFRWTHFGGDGRALEELRGHATKVLPAGSFRFMGHVPNREVLEHYARSPASLFVNVSESEGVPVSIMEAMAHAIPPLATSAGDTDRLVTRERDGWLLPVHADATAIADGFETVWRLSPQQYSGYSTAAHQTWATGWSTKETYGHFAEELAQLSGS